MITLFTVYIIIIIIVVVLLIKRNRRKYIEIISLGILFIISPITLKECFDTHKHKKSLPKLTIFIDNRKDIIKATPKTYYPFKFYMGNSGNGSLYNFNVTLYFPLKFKVHTGIYLLKNINDDPTLEKNQIDTGSFLIPGSKNRNYKDVEFPYCTKTGLKNIHYINKDIRAYKTSFTTPDTTGNFPIYAVLKATNHEPVIKEFTVKISSKNNK